MMYKTRKVVSFAPASNASTGILRNCLFMAIPILIVAVTAFTAAVLAMPLFGVLIGGIGALYLPLFLVTKSSNVCINQDMQVSWKPVSRPDTALLKNSLLSLLLMIVFGIILIVR